jgi:phage baseplate assembly protein V
MLPFTTQLERFLRPINLRTRNAVKRCVVHRVDDERKVQQVQISLLKGELFDKKERFQHYGFTSNPPLGMEGIAVQVMGDPGNTVVIADGDRKYRIKPMESGEVAIYTDEGDSIILKRNNKIEIKTSELTIDAATVKIKSGNVEIGDGATQPAIMSEALLNWLKTHTHGGGTVEGSTIKPNETALLEATPPVSKTVKISG